MRRAVITVGERSGSRVALAINRHAARYPTVHVRCDCGHELTVSATSFRKSLNCNRCSTSGPTQKYGNRYAGETRLYKIWTEMRRRCRSRQGWCDRGITVCKEWDLSFVKFEEWSLANGYAPKMTIDRVDSTGNYEPSNCEWVTRQENSRRVRADYHMVRREKLPSSGMLSFGC